MVKTMTNLEIFNAANGLLAAFNDEAETHFPVKINFFLQKNTETVVKLAKEIEENRIKIIQAHGQPVEGDPDNYQINEGEVELVNNELRDLFDLSQDVNINMLKLDWFDNIDLSMNQVSAIAFMIEE